MLYPIPLKASTAWQAINMTANIAKNPGLLYERYVPNWGAAPNDHQKNDWKKAGFKMATSFKADAELHNAHKERWQAVVDLAYAKPFYMSTDWRFVSGLGRKGPLEVGFTFHRYGFPILPGSSVKGLARAGARQVLEVSDEDAQKNPDFVTIFGRAPGPGDNESVAQAGQAIFFEAIPKNVPTLELDIMNPHFPKYYDDKSHREYPVDWDSPRPVYFLTVAPKQAFCFAIGWRGKVDHPLRAKAEEWLKFGLENLGAGAKTSAGYGYFVSP